MKIFQFQFQLRVTRRQVGGRRGYSDEGLSPTLCAETNPKIEGKTREEGDEGEGVSQAEEAGQYA